MIKKIGSSSKTITSSLPHVCNTQDVTIIDASDNEPHVSCTTIAVVNVSVPFSYWGVSCAVDDFILTCGATSLANEEYDLISLFFKHCF